MLLPRPRHTRRPRSRPNFSAIFTSYLVKGLLLIMNPPVALLVAFLVAFIVPFAPLLPGLHAFAAGLPPLPTTRLSLAVVTRTLARFRPASRHPT